MKKYLLASIALIALVGVSFIAYKSANPPTLADDAQSFMLAVYEGDGRAAFRYADPKEIRALGLTPEKLDRLLDECVTPKYSEAKEFRIVQIGVNEDAAGAPSQGFCKAEVKDRGGLPQVLLTVVDASDQGGKASVMSELLQAWRINYRIKHKIVKPTFESNAKAKLEGYASDKDTLQTLAIEGLTEGDKVIPWSEMVEAWSSHSKHKASMGVERSKGSTGGAPDPSKRSR